MEIGERGGNRRESNTRDKLGPYHFQFVFFIKYSSYHHRFFIKYSSDHHRFFITSKGYC